MPSRLKGYKAYFFLAPILSLIWKETWSKLSGFYECPEFPQVDIAALVRVVWPQTSL